MKSILKFFLFPIKIFRRFKLKKLRSQRKKNKEKEHPLKDYNYPLW